MHFHQPGGGKKTNREEIWRIDSSDTPPHITARTDFVPSTRLSASRNAVAGDHEENHYTGVPKVEIPTPPQAEVVAHNAQGRQAAPGIHHGISRFPNFLRGKPHPALRGHG